MDPVIGGLWVAANFAISAYSNKQQAKIEASSIKMQTEQARLQAAEQAYESTKNFRQSVSANLALSGMGVGGSSGFRAITSESISNYFADQQSIANSGLFAQLSGVAGVSTSKSNRFAKDVTAGANATQLANQLGLFNKETYKKAK